MRKKKQSTKLKSYNRFGYNNSPAAKGHPNYFFAKTKSGKYKSFGLTTEINEPYPKIKLNKNPNSSDSRDAYIKKNVFTTKRDYVKFNDNLDAWAFDKSDMPVVRHLKKTYKKAYKRHKKKK